VIKVMAIVQTQVITTIHVDNIATVEYFPEAPRLYVSDAKNATSTGYIQIISIYTRTGTKRFPVFICRSINITIF